MICPTCGSCVIAPPVALDGFAEWYAAFPRKVGVATARKAWRETTRERPSLADMLKALAWQKMQWKDAKFIPHPATYLRAHRWADEPPKKPDGKDPRGVFVVGSGWVK